MLLSVYGFGAGQGFVKDDIAWVAANHLGAWSDVVAFLERSNGFYRPVVALSFAIDRALYGLWPFGYGLTNLLLLLGCGAAVLGLARTVGLTPLAASLAAALWALNFHGINMAILWLSGRTELFLVLFAATAGALFLRGRTWLATLCVFLAMLSKEQAVLLPAIITTWAWMLADRDRAFRMRLEQVVSTTWAMWLALGLYLWLRGRTDAFTPTNSPWFYTFTFEPFKLLENTSHYLDRAATFSLLMVCLTVLISWQRPHLPRAERRVLMLGLIWFAGSYALTIFLPVRSSLYACLPSVGIALVAGAVLADLWQRALPAARRRLAIAAVVILVALLPVYHARNVRWTELATLSAEVFRELQPLSREPAVSSVQFLDDRTTRRSIGNAYGGLLPDAVTLAVGRPLTVFLTPPMDGINVPPESPAPQTTAIIAFRNGYVTRVQ